MLTHNNLTLCDLALVTFVLTSALVCVAAVIHKKAPPKKPIGKYTLIRSGALSFANFYVACFLELAYYNNIIRLPFLKIYRAYDDHSVSWLVFSTCFYLVTTDVMQWILHRLMHTKFLFRFHSLHHTSKNPTAFDFASVHPVESMLWIAVYKLVPIFIPVHYGAIIYYGLLMSIVPILEHGNGVELIKKIPLVSKMFSVDFHNSHHRLYNHNYGVGIFTSLWDRLFGTYKDDSHTGFDNSTRL